MTSTRDSAVRPPMTRTLPAIERFVDSVEGADGADALVEGLSPAAGALAASRLGPVLQGEWLGHAFHPLLTDFPLGCWLAAGLLDLVGGRSARPAATRLVGIGVAMVPITAASGLADWSTVDDQRVRRVGAVHAAGNTAVAAAYFMSWRARRRGRHWTGVAWGLGGGLLAWITGYLGGHLSFARGVSVGARGLAPVERPAAAPVSAAAQ